MNLAIESANGDNFVDGERVQVLYIAFLRLVIIKVLPISQ
jgi:hypothetical protein